MRRLGILAGRGGLVEELVNACLAQERPYFILAFEGQADSEFVNLHPHAWVGVGAIGRALRLLREAHVQDLVMAGAFTRPSFSSLKVDFVGAKWLAQVLGKALGDDALLRFLTRKLEEEGFQVIGADALVGGSLLGGKGTLTTNLPTPQALLDARKGREVLNKLADADVGQAVVVQEGLVLGIEAIEGTQALITRTGLLIRSGEHKPVLVKAIKQNQDRRCDRPTLGPDTVDALVAARFAGVVYEAEEVILLQARIMIEKANAAGVFIHGDD